jgi:hypothetical protein
MLNGNESDKAETPDLFTISVMLVSGQEYEYTDMALGWVEVTKDDLNSEAKWIRIDQTYWNSDEVQSVTILPQEAE